jgi:peptidyl-prolyl cis-trans isomerase C
MLMRTFAVVVAAAVLALTGCSRSGDTAVVARVNQAKITAGDFKRQLEGLDNFQMEQAVATDQAARKEFLDDLIGIELVLQEAKRQGLDKDAEFKKSQETVKKEYEEAKKRLDRRYQEAGRNELFKALLKKELQDKAAKLAPPTDAEIRAFFEKNRSKMMSMDGKPIAFKVVEPQIKQRLFQEKQRDLYLGYIKGLREKAKVAVDEKALDALASSLAGTVTLQVPQQPPAAQPGGATPDDKKKK